MTSRNLKLVQVKKRKNFILFPDKSYLLEVLKNIIQEIKTSEIELFSGKNKVKR
jgi:hypothetical protein